MEKLVLSLLHATRRLRRYFQAHPIVIITEQPIKQILSRTKNSGRMAKWAMELGEHDINYRPRTSIKGQILTDIILERPREDSPATGILSPEGAKFTYALRFEFDVSNNEAEYEVLIVGLRKEQSMIKYLEKARTLIRGFKTFLIEQVPRSENKGDLGVVEEEGYTLMTPLFDFLTEGTLPAEAKKARALTSTTSPWPFYKWGIDISGPFPEAQGEIVSDNEKQFAENPFKDWCEKLNIKQRFASVKHPQTNDLVERANIFLGEVIKARLDKGSKDWIEGVLHVLWAHRTMIKSSN
ncbi:reverse transcriptase domain-containing protein [Tanacetum coccineum]|uniref:Reverse transcriptase domain-containing protein n=1 Tax=Tanacetum coccineum TaxID=301880 RepID=A0ABQ5F908_9ASTR